MNREVLVQLAGMGLCESCQTPLSLQSLPAEAIDATLICPVPNCRVELTGRSFGYDEIDGKPKRTRWVGPQGQWVTERPTKDFILGNFHINTGIAPTWR